MPVKQTNVNIEEIFSWQNIILYFVAINLFVFFIMFLDKKKAKYCSWRFPE